MQRHDVVIIGGGPGGYVAAIRAGLAGLKTVLVEKSIVGGTCLNRGCIPTKAMIAAAAACYRAAHASSVGMADTAIPFSDDGAFAHARRTVETLVKGVEALLKKRNVTVVKGKGFPKQPGVVEVESDGRKDTIETMNVIIATGSVPFFPKGLEPDGKIVLGSDEILEHNARVGKSVAVIGGGVIGVELAEYYAMTGREVTVIEMLDRLLPMATQAASREITRALKKMKLKILTGRKVVELNKKENGAVLAIDDGTVVEVETVLCAVGRRAFLDGVDLKGIGAAQHKNGRIVIGERNRVGHGVYAIGDVAGLSPMLAHAASHQGIGVVEDILGLSPDEKPEPVASVVYSHPEVVWVGDVPVTPEAEKLAKSASFPLRALGRAHTIGETAGYATLYYDGSNRVVGGDMVGEGVSELAGTVALAIRLGATLEDFARIPFPHPTFSESLMEAAHVALGTPIHTM
jgi:dihydrolipoamide dehydrogenase